VDPIHRRVEPRIGPASPFISNERREHRGSARLPAVRKSRSSRAASAAVALLGVTPPRMKAIRIMDPTRGPFDKLRAGSGSAALLPAFDLPTHSEPRGMHSVSPVTGQPRQGRRDHSPALQRWGRRHQTKSPVRTTETCHHRASSENKRSSKRTPKKGEQMAQACENACFRQPSRIEY